jgi:hypothetical protein
VPIIITLTVVLSRLHFSQGIQTTIHIYWTFENTKYNSQPFRLSYISLGYPVPQTSLPIMRTHIHLSLSSNPKYAYLGHLETHTLLTDVLTYIHLSMSSDPTYAYLNHPNLHKPPLDIKNHVHLVRIFIWPM